MKDLSIVIIGAGSKEFSKGIIDDLILEKDLHNHQIHLKLVDINPETLEEIFQFATKRVKQYNVPICVTKTTKREDALPNANYVLVAVEVKRMELWEQDFRIPFSFGFKHVYGENGGPGAIFHTLRNYGILFPIAKDIERLCPEALLINFTNPEARILKGILSLTNVKAIGLCHGFYGFREIFEKISKLNSNDFNIITAGMNHLYTFLKIEEKATKKDFIPEFTKMVNNNLDLLPPMTRYMWEKFDVLGYPSDDHIGEYIPYAYEFFPPRWEFGIENRKVISTDVDSYMAYGAWGKKFKKNGLLDVQSYLDDIDSNQDKKLDELTFSGELAIPVIADIELNRSNFREAVNVLNTERSINNLASDACIEVPAIVDGEGIHPVNVGSLPEGFAAMIRNQNDIQKLITLAWSQKSKKILLQALLLDPIIDSAINGEKLLDYMLEIQKDYLPEFN